MKDCLTIVLRGNAAGDLKLKPMVIYHSENPRALKDLIIEYLPVIYKSNKKSMDDGCHGSTICNFLFVPSLEGVGIEEQLG